MKQTNLTRIGFGFLVSVLLLFAGSFTAFGEEQAPHVPIPGGLQGKSCIECHIAGEFGTGKQLSKYSLAKAFETYYLSSHGKARLLGDPRAPYCNTCHEGSSWSDIIPVSSKLSKMHPDNMGKVCAQCHGEAILNSKIAEGSMHLPINDRPIISNDPRGAKYGFLPGKTKRESAYFIGGVDVAMATYWAFFSLLFCVMGLMTIYLFFDLIKKILTRKTYMAALQQTDGEKVKRFGVWFRIQHILLFSSVLVAIVTGIPVKYAAQPWAQSFVQAIGGNEMRHDAHMVAGFVMIAVGVLHLLQVLFNVKQPFWRRPMFPRWGDLRDFKDHNLYNLGLKKEMPKMGRFTWYEKLDYIGATWGIGVMGVTGIIMFFLGEFSQYLSLAVVQMAWIAHGEEAMLATLFLMIVHMYHAHFNPWKFPGASAWYDGKIPKAEKEHDHALED